MNTNLGYTYSTVPKRWEEGLLCGNGTIGALMLGKPQNESIYLTHEKLFIPLYEKEILPINLAPHLNKIRNMLFEGKYREASEFAWELAKKEGYKDLVWTDPFFPACSLNIEFQNENIVDYSRSLNFDTGYAAVKIKTNNGTIKRSLFVSRKRNISVLQIQSDYKITVQISKGHLNTPEYDNRHNLINGLKYTIIEYDKDIISMKCAFKYTQGGYICISKIEADGVLKNIDESTQIIDATNIKIFTTVDVNNDIENLDKSYYIEFLRNIPNNVELLFNEHKSIHKTLFDRVSFNISKYSQFSDSSIYLDSKKGIINNKFIEKIFNAGRYAIISSCGDYPPVLQGIWTGIYAVPWSSDYTNDGNLPTAILGLLPLNNAELMKRLLNYYYNLIPHMRENAKRLFGCRGIVLPSRTSTKGYNFHFNIDWPIIYWTAGAGWIARYFYDYWLYTQDNNFFLDRVLPFMKEVAEFYEDFMIEDKHGKWMFIPSYSPENTPLNSNSQTTINATMDIAVAKEVFSNLIEGCSTLGIETENIIKWKRILEKMPKYQVNEDGALKEWCYDFVDNYDHRHASHLYPTFYCIDKDLIKDNLIEAAKKAYRLKKQFKNKEEGIMAFGLIQVGMAAAHLKDSEMVEEIIYKLAKDYYYENYASSHDAGPSLFNTDISGGLPALIVECIAQSYTQQDEYDKIEYFVLEVLPIKITKWSDGKLKGLKTRGNFEVDIEWENHKLKHLLIKNNSLNKLKIVYENKEIIINNTTKEVILTHDSFGI
ncbi:glycoside hydrolase N-terminal domain-containing protein [Caldicellulosiruptoraceae bacterium PP1]